MAIIRQKVEEINKKTAESLREIASSPDVRRLSRLSLPQIDRVVEDIVRLLPGNDLPTFILSGLTTLPGRQVSYQQVEKDTALLASAWERFKHMALFGSIFAGPAVAIMLYQKLLKLAGKSADLAFPEGYWQFYVDYALREDTGRHAHETIGFDQVLDRHQIKLSSIDRVTAWVMGIIDILFEYPMILRNEWRERVYLRELIRVASADQALLERVNFAARSWVQNRPYRREADVQPGESYPLYRQRKFDDFIAVYLAQLNRYQRQTWLEQVQSLKEFDLPAYQKQMSIAGYLEAGPYRDKRIPLKLTDSRIGIIYNGIYYLIPVSRPQKAEPADVTVVRSQVSAIFSTQTQASQQSSVLSGLAGCPKTELPSLLEKLGPELQDQLDYFRKMPVLLNIDHQDTRIPLANLRQAERGIGSHPVTVHDTGKSIVFDLSHVFFDGIWGAAFSEIVTSNATSWAVYLNTLPQIFPPAPVPQVLNLSFTEAERFEIKRLRAAPREGAAETDRVALRNLLALRRVFKLRNDLIRLTVNDILLLYRAIHAVTYRPDSALLRRLEEKAQTSGESAVQAALDELKRGSTKNPTVLIPVDGSGQSPRDRVYPLCLQIPVRELGLVPLHQDVIEALDQYRAEGQSRGPTYERFDELQRRYLGILAGLGVVLAAHKRGASRGKTVSVETLKLLAHLPEKIQHLLDQIPSRFPMINQYIKGQEVFSNIGLVSPSSSLRRFLSAKDDNLGKQLAWGILTDANLTMHITLRDFRPHVQGLLAAGEDDLAQAVTRDYLAAYTGGLNRYVNDLRRMTMASRETNVPAEIGLLNVDLAS